MKRTLLLLLVLAVGGVWLLAGAGPEPRREQVVSAGVPLEEVHPAGAGPHPGVVVAHGFSGSARLMEPFGDSLAARGYVVVLLDFAGHGANTGPLPDQTAGTDESTRVLQHDLDVALAHLRSLPDVDPARIAMVGHSMGAGAVTRYAADHPDVTATVAISLPGAGAASPQGPARLLAIVGGLEFPGFRSAATTVTDQRDDRALRVIPGVEHITVLYAPETHRQTVAWLDSAFGLPGDAAIPFPARRLFGAALLVLAFLIGFHPLTALLSGRAASPRSRAAGPRPGAPGMPRLGMTVLVSGVAAVAGVVVARFLPTTDLPIAIAGYVIGYATVTGALLLLYGVRRPESPAVSSLRLLPVVPYAIVAIAVPVHLGLTHAVPVGDRWWLLLIMWAAFALISYAAERIAAGSTVLLLAISAVFVVVLAAAAVAGLVSSFVVLALFPLVGLFLWQALWSAILHRFAAPAWLIALTGAVVLSWPLAVTLPLVSS
ncbi:dienelactone hydrolase family protein [Actinoplanes derwentensis]|uniref:Dienelactone hydrolase n=1 Tax=Actinoplanes derwentensis TaxID=113562 RepID=A0A1H1S5K0_9ACTN|nr:alpha/beta fold hydrolase [Actinoplanes derwentensis]SDS43241.1 Dienelactone hydrolase [Actinoplanes derwentensis]